MTQADHEHKKAECWEEASRRYGLSLMNGTIHAAFNFAFDRAYALGKQEIKQETDADTVIHGWVARDNNGKLYIYSDKPERYNKGFRWVLGSAFLPLPSDLFPDLTWDDDPIEVELIIKRKKANDEQ